MDSLANDCCDIQINSLFSLNHISSRYFLSTNNLVINYYGYKYCNINFTQNGYAYVTLLSMSGKWFKVTLHKLIALARINNGPYEIIEHINDNTMDLRVSNLKFSTFKDNSLNAFKNGKREIVSNIFKLIMNDGSEYTDTIINLSKILNIPKGTLYDRFYSNQSGRYIKSIIKTNDKLIIDQKQKSNRSIDYRKNNYTGILELDNCVVVFNDNKSSVVIIE